MLEKITIAVPAEVTVDIAENNIVTVKGTKGTLKKEFPSEIMIKMEGQETIVVSDGKLKKMEGQETIVVSERKLKALQKLSRTLLCNMIKGVTEGHEEILEVKNCSIVKDGKVLTLSFKDLQPIVKEDPKGIETIPVATNKIIIRGIDKEKVSQYVAEVKKMKRVGYNPREDSTEHKTTETGHLELEDIILTIKSIRVPDGYRRRLGFSALVAVGDRNGHVGIGFGKAAEISEAISKGKKAAMENLIEVPMDDNGSVTCRIVGRFSDAEVLLSRSLEGTGIIAGDSVRVILELAGIKNVVAKSLGCWDKQKIVLATIEGLKELKSKIDE